MGDNASSGSLVVSPLTGLSWANLFGTSIIESKRFVGYSVAVNIASSIVLIHTGTYMASQVFSARSEQLKKSEKKWKKQVNGATEAGQVVVGSFQSGKE